MFKEMFENLVKIGASVGKKVFGYASHIIACILVGVARLLASLFMMKKYHSFSLRHAEKAWRRLLCPIGAVVGASLAALTVILPPSLLMGLLVMKSWKNVAEAFRTVCEVGPSAITSVLTTGVSIASIAAITLAIIKAINQCSKKQVQRQFLEYLRECIG